MTQLLKLDENQIRRNECSVQLVSYLSNPYRNFR